MRLLLVEDDERLARGVAASLEAAGFSVDAWTAGKTRCSWPGPSLMPR